MSIDSITGSSSTRDPAAASTPAGALGMGASKDEFLRLLVAQLQAQDPLEPQKGAEFVAQLAQFASLEQAAETNSHLTTLTGNQASASSAAYAALVGKTAAARTDTVTIDSTGVPAMGVHLDGAASRASLTVTDSNGNVVRTLDLGTRAAGDSDVVWDGKDDKGGQLPPGTYKVAVKASTADGTAVAAMAELRGVIRSLEFAGGTPRFRIGSATVSPADIISIQG